MIEEVKLYGHYISGSGYPCTVTKITQHGQDCSIRMITYVVHSETFDSPPGKEWTVEEGFFLRRFAEDNDIVRLYDALTPDSNLHEREGGAYGGTLSSIHPTFERLFATKIATSITEGASTIALMPSGWLYPFPGRVTEAALREIDRVTRREVEYLASLRGCDDYYGQYPQHK